MKAQFVVGKSKKAGEWVRRVYLLLGVLVTSVYSFLPSTLAQNICYALIIASTTAAIIAGVCIYRPGRPLPWYVAALGIALFIVGQVVWTVYEDVLQVEYPFPSVADVFFTAGYLFLIAGLLLGSRSSGRNRATLIDPLIITAGPGMLAWVFLIEPVVSDPTRSGSERAVLTAYLFVYVAVLATMVRLLIIPEKRLPAFYIICGSWMILFISDVAFGATTSGTYETGSPYYVGAQLSFVLLGTAALHPSMVPLSEPVPDAPTKLTWRWLILLTGSMMMAPIVLAVQTALGERIDVPIIVVGSVVLFLLVAIRMAGMIDERKVLEKRLEFQAFHDPLTGLPNRALFSDRLEHALARVSRTDEAIAVLFLDLDGFKEINDRLGHEAGDQLLVAVSRRLQESLRLGDTVARLGGDEFTILLEESVMEEGDAVQTAERIAEELGSPFDLGGQRVSVTTSIGIAPSIPGRHNPTNLLRAADIAMYRAKNNGKARYEIFTS